MATGVITRVLRRDKHLLFRLFCDKNNGFSKDCLRSCEVLNYVYRRVTVGTGGGCTNRSLHEWSRMLRPTVTGLKACERDFSRRNNLHQVRSLFTGTCKYERESVIETVNDNEETSLLKAKNELLATDVITEDISEEDLERMAAEYEEESLLDIVQEEKPRRIKRKDKKTRTKTKIDEKKKVLTLSGVIAKEYMGIEEIVAFLRDNFCLDLCVIKVPESPNGMKYVDYFVVASGRSTRHLRVMAFGLAAKFKDAVRAKDGSQTAVVEGSTCPDWMVIDLGSSVVHFMLQETREIYELEKLWTLGQKYDDQYQNMLIEAAEEPMTISEIEKMFEDTTHEEKSKSFHGNVNIEEVISKSTSSHW